MTQDTPPPVQAAANTPHGGWMEELSAASVSQPVPDALKTMKMDRVFWSHFSPNLGPGGWVTGALLVSLGLDFRAGVAAVLLGNLIGALPVALAAAIGHPPA